MITTPTLDNFDRAAENPLSQGGQWSRDLAVSGSGGLQVISNAARRAGGSYSWRVTPFPSGDKQVWALAARSSPGNNNEWAGILMELQNPGTAGVTGYYARSGDPFPGAENWEILTISGTTFTRIVAIASGRIQPGQHMLFQRVGNTLELWKGTTGGTVWTLMCSIADTTWMEGEVGLAIQTDDMDWSGMGGGVPPTFVPQVMRYA